MDSIKSMIFAKNPQGCKGKFFKAGLFLNENASENVSTPNGTMPKGFARDMDAMQAAARRSEVEHMNTPSNPDAKEVYDPTFCIAESDEIAEDPRKSMLADAAHTSPVDDTEGPVPHSDRSVARSNWVEHVQEHYPGEY